MPLEPSSRSMVEVRGRVILAQRTILTFCLALLTIIIGFAMLSQAKDLFAPVISALLLGIVMTPLSDGLDRLKVPAPLAAFVSVLLALAFIVVLILLIEPYATQVINRAPVIWYELRGTIEEFQRLLRGLEQISDDMAQAIEPDNDQSDSDAETVTLPSLTDALFYAPFFAAQFMIFTGTLYFFLLARTDIYVWVTATFRRLDEHELRVAGKQVSRYVLTISAINLGLGVMVAIVMQLIGMPSAIVWGMMAFLLNFVLYLGPAVLFATFLVAGIVVFDGAYSFLPAAAYVALNLTEAQFITPTLVGRSLSVNPLLIFLSLVFWLWLWGPIGGIIAIPLQIWVTTIWKSGTRQTLIQGLMDEPSAKTA